MFVHPVTDHAAGFDDITSFGRAYDLGLGHIQQISDPLNDLIKIIPLGDEIGECTKDVHQFIIMSLL
jgi:hypothetical protein